MQKLTITALSISLALSITACGKSSNSSKAAASQSAASTGGGTGGGGALPQLSAAQAGAIANLLGQVVSDLFNSLSGLPIGDFSAGQQSSASLLNCPVGGTANLSGAGNLGIGGTIGAPTANLQTGSGSVTLTNCEISVAGTTIKLNGTVSLASVTGTGAANINLALQKVSFTTQGAGNTVGNLSVAVGTNSVNCAIATASTLTANGVFNTANFVTTGVVSATTAGTICGLPVNQPIQFSF